MPCPHCVGADDLFGDRVARSELKALRTRGPKKSTRMLLDGVQAAGRSLLDVGGGVGAIQQAFAEAGATRITGVDASHAYLAAARQEAERKGYADRTEQHFGDLVEIADRIEPHDVVTLDRVLCCYPDVDALMQAATDKASRAVGVVFPKDRWWARMGVACVNLFMRIRGSAYRAYIHPEDRVEALARQAGFDPSRRSQTWLWHVWVWERPAPEPAGAR